MADNKILQIFKESASTNPCYIRPTPLIGIQRESLRNSMGTFGGRYTITLTGTIIDNGGTYGGTNSNAGTSSSVEDKDAAYTIISKQQELRGLFSAPVLRFEINNTDGSQVPDTRFYAKLQSLNFEDGVFVNTCRYTATFEADFMMDDGDGVHDGDVMAALIETTDDNKSFTGSNISSSISTIREGFGGIISDMSESWSIEVDESLGVTGTNYDEIVTPKSYRITRDVSITGRSYYEDGDEGFVKYEAWSEAKNFARKSILTNAVEDYPGMVKYSSFAPDVIGLSDSFGGYNHFRVENIDKTAGVVNITDTWLMCSGTAFENYSASISSSNDSPYVGVTLNGTIKGVSSISPSGTFYGGDDDRNLARPYENALKKYHEVSNTGVFGINSHLYRRANSIVQPGLNPQPLSIGLSEDKFAGEITYNIQFDNRPQNVVTEAISEVISVNDTYPGDLYALIPVIGRPTGPVLQYIGGRTEYRRDISIELVFDYTDIDYGNNTGANIRKKLILSKPSLNEPTRSQINGLVKELSPMSEPALRKCFLNPPTENWTPKEGRYSLNLSWVYELEDSRNPTPSSSTTPEPITGQT